MVGAKIKTKKLIFSDLTSLSSHKVMLGLSLGLITAQSAQPLSCLVSLPADKTETKEILSNNSWQEGVTDPIMKASTEKGDHKSGLMSS